MAKTKAKKAAKIAKIKDPPIPGPYMPELNEDYYERSYIMCMPWRDAWQYLKQGKPVKRVAWMGYWIMENGKLFMHCKDGSIVTLDKCDEAFTLANIAQSDWVPVTQGMKDNLDAVHKAKCLAYKKGK